MRWWQPRRRGERDGEDGGGDGARGRGFYGKGGGGRSGGSASSESRVKTRATESDPPTLLSSNLFTLLLIMNLIVKPSNFV